MEDLSITLNELPKALEGVLAQHKLSRVGFTILLNSVRGYDDRYASIQDVKSCNEEVVYKILSGELSRHKEKVEDVRDFVQTIMGTDSAVVDSWKAKAGLAQEEAKVTPLAQISDWAGKLGQKADKTNRFNELMEHLYCQEVRRQSPQGWWMEGIVKPLNEKWGTALTSTVLGKALEILKAKNVVRVPPQMMKRAFEQQSHEQALVVKLGLHRVMGEAMMPAQLACLGLSEDTQKRMVLGKIT